MSAKSRARVRLEATTMMIPEHALHAVKIAAGRVKGGGASLLTTGLQNIGAQVNIEHESPGQIALSITSGRRILELCTFSAVASNGNGCTILRVGGLDTYKTTQSTFLGFIPVGPKAIAGYAPYKRFLEEVSAELRAVDSRVSTVIVGTQ